MRALQGTVLRIPDKVQAQVMAVVGTYLLSLSEMPIRNAPAQNNLEAVRCWGMPDDLSGMYRLQCLEVERLLELGLWKRRKS